MDNFSMRIYLPGISYSKRMNRKGSLFSPPHLEKSGFWVAVGLSVSASLSNWSRRSSVLFTICTSHKTAFVSKDNVRCLFKHTPRGLFTLEFWPIECNDLHSLAATRSYRWPELFFKTKYFTSKLWKDPHISIVDYLTMKYCSTFPIVYILALSHFSRWTKMDDWEEEVIHCNTYYTFLCHWKRCR